MTKQQSEGNRAWEGSKIAFWMSYKNVTTQYHTIVKRATSAHRQVATYMNALDSKKDHDEALRLVVDHLIEETLIGT